LLKKELKEKKNPGEKPRALIKGGLEGAKNTVGGEQLAIKRKTLGEGGEAG